MLHILAPFSIIAALLAAPASAQVHGLSPAEKSAAIEAASHRPDADDPALLPGLAQERGLHGAFGAMIGTGGARSIHGILGMPLGDTGSATLAFSHSRLPGFHGRSDFGRRGDAGFGPDVPLR